MNNLEEALEETLRQIFVFNFKNSDYEPNTQKDILFFPRKKLKVKKVRSSYYEPKSWFIESRCKEKATKLDKPTEISGEALTSGFRSGIILDKNEKYVKLKGIHPVNLLGKPKDRGLCDFHESLRDQMNAFGLEYLEFAPLNGKPRFIEAHLWPLEFDLKQFVNEFKNPRKIIYSSEVNHNEKKSFKRFSESVERELSKYKHLSHLSKKDDYTFVSGLEIDADTRLDEAIYNLTKKDLNGVLKIERDNMLHCLSFTAGETKALLTLGYLSWGRNLKNTDNHIGNFVVCSDEGIIDSKMTDLSGIKPLYRFENKEKFFKHLENELNSLVADFYWRNTYSSPVPLKYRYFSKELRDECASALKTGYWLNMLFTIKKFKEIWPIKEPERIFVPKNMIITEEEFRYNCNKISREKSL